MGLWLKSCPKCKGDLYSDRDIMGYYRQCLQCGYTFYEPRRRPVRAAASTPVPSEDEGQGPGAPKPTLSEAA
jgi:DNA-directed RNA polymerase subunit M/transcription elongation factor TFIIS